MTKKNGVFVKINYKSTTNKLNNMSEKRAGSGDDAIFTKFLYCAGMLNKDGGTMIFRAKDMQEADYIANNNPFVNSDTYRYEILKSDVIFLA